MTQRKTYKILRDDNTVVDTFSSVLNAVEYLHSPHSIVTPDMYVVDLKGFVVYKQEERDKPKKMNPRIFFEKKLKRIENNFRPKW